eukprot:504784-Alexandrium_andersonii.AAC.1
MEPQRALLTPSVPFVALQNLRHLAAQCAEVAQQSTYDMDWRDPVRCIIWRAIPSRGRARRH